MSQLNRASHPFRFYTRLHISELTGLKASNLQELLALIREVPGSCIYHHTHRFLQQHQYLSPEPPNDFAYWVTEVLGESELGEMLASIDTVRFATIRSLREKIVGTIEGYMKDNPTSERKFARKNEEFYFIKSVSIVIPTRHEANDLNDFSDILGKVTTNSIYFHIFEARLRLGRTSNDFSNWLETSLGERELAARISKLDPYTYTLDDLRKKLIAMTQEALKHYA